MALTPVQKIALSLSGVTAFGIGSFILSAPHRFYASYGIALAPDASLLSELRAPGAGLAALGLIMLAWMIRPALAQTSAIVAITVFLAFPFGRIVSFVVDGAPSSGILAALVLEIAIAALCCFAIAPWRDGFIHRPRRLDPAAG